MTINVTLASVLLIGVAIYIVIISGVIIKATNFDEDAVDFWNEYWGDANSSVLQIDSVKQSAAGNYEIEKTSNRFLNLIYEKWKGLDDIWINVRFIQRVIVSLTQLAIFVLSVKFVTDSVITVGELVTLNWYALMFFGPFVALGQQWQQMNNAVVTVGQAETLFKQPEEIYHPENAVKNNNMKGEISFKNVFFKYAPNQAVVLNDISFETKQGDLVALVGESGGGKSTLISLISAYYFPTKGSVEVDGVDTRRYDLEYLRSRIAIVPQEVALFNDTIKNNIRYGNFDKSDSEVFKAAKEVYIHDFIETLPDGYETFVGERGIKLSVGQKQRLSIARAILRDPVILILDEPTSALDAKTESQLINHLKKL